LKTHPLILALCLAILVPGNLGAEQPSDVKVLIPWLLAEDRELKGIPFGDVIEAATGHAVIPVEVTRDADLLAGLNACIAAALARCNEADHPIRQVGRINEASAHLESEILLQLDAVPGWKAGIPKTASGSEQRSGYPDIRLELEDGRVVYLDPKLYSADSRSSSFRSFYYEPKTATNKVNDPAMHLLVGVQHNGETGQNLRLNQWELVDLSRLLIQLKAEFQASNRDLYQDETVVITGSVQD